MLTDLSRGESSKLRSGKCREAQIELLLAFAIRRNGGISMKAMSRRQNARFALTKRAGHLGLSRHRRSRTH
jgi:hypothetical protein